MLSATHVNRTRHSHQVAAAALHILREKADKNYCESQSQFNEASLSYNIWCDTKAKHHPEFMYWGTALELQLAML